MYRDVPMGSGSLNWSGSSTGEVRTASPMQAMPPRGQIDSRVLGCPFLTGGSSSPVVGLVDC